MLNVLFPLLQTATATISLLMLLRVIASFLGDPRSSPIVATIYRLSEPLLAPVRRWVPPIGGVVDLSPMVVIFLCRGVEYGVLWLFR